jgi:hypothetical protein
MLDPWFTSQGARGAQERAKDCFKRVLLLVEGLPNKIYLFGQDWCRVSAWVAVQTKRQIGGERGSGLGNIAQCYMQMYVPCTVCVRCCLSGRRSHHWCH